MSDRTSRSAAAISCKLLRPADISRAVQIEQLTSPLPWESIDFHHYLGQAGTTGLVARLADSVVGYLLYEVHPNRTVVLNLAVDPLAQRHGVGTRLLAGVLLHPTCLQLRPVIVETRETDLPAQLFLQSLGARLVNRIPNTFLDSGEECWQFQFRSEWMPADSPTSDGSPA